jgi:hypothetical protein
MGAGESGPGSVQTLAPKSHAYDITEVHRSPIVRAAPLRTSSAERVTRTRSMHIADSLIRSPLLSVAYHGVWTMSYPNAIPPPTRTAQCFVFDPTNEWLVIAYGADSRGTCLNDAWILDIRAFSWRNLSRALLPPRAFASAVLIDRRMFVFGGVNNNTFFADLHAISIDTGEITLFRTSADPSPRSSAVLFYDSAKLYLWSGVNTSIPNDLSILDLASSSWSTFPQECQGRAAASFCEHQGEHYVYGSSTSLGLLKFDRARQTFEAIQTIGISPPPQLNHTRLVSVDDYLFVIGGESNSSHMYLFALDVGRRWWFAFHVRPDQTSLSLADGIVSKIGLFMLPRESAASIVYSPRGRELVSVMGSRLVDPSPVFKIEIGEALGVLHVRSDMYEMYVKTIQTEC